MKRTLIGLGFALSATLLTQGCSGSGSGSGSRNPGTQAAPAEGPAWKLTLKSSCTTSAAGCRNGYGFTVAADGSYQVGPGPEGQLLKGTLNPEESLALEEALHSVLNKVLPEVEAPETCEIPATASSDTDQLTLNRLGRELQLARQDEKEFCFRSVSKEEAQALHKAIAVLSQQYYPVPFPDACTDAVAALEALYAPLRTCSTDADCAYVDHASFTVLGTVLGDGPNAAVVTDSCTIAPPLVVAHRELADAARDSLLTARAKARAACGQRMSRTQCTGIRGFYTQEGAPTCSAAKTCQVNPAITLHPL